MFNFIFDLVDFLGDFFIHGSNNFKHIFIWFGAFIVLVGIYLAMQGKV